MPPATLPAKFPLLGDALCDPEEDEWPPVVVVCVFPFPSEDRVPITSEAKAGEVKAAITRRGRNTFNNTWCFMIVD